MAKRFRKFITPQRPAVISHEFYERSNKYEIKINNERFSTEAHKNELVNLLLDLYYENYVDLLSENSTAKEYLKEIQDFVSRKHIHKWIYIDKGNFIDIDRYVYRFVCYKCGNYKHIEEKYLEDGIHQIVEESFNEELINFAPPTHLSSVTNYKSSSNLLG